ncbi:hypothetical protein GC194_13375 [bacterium]|nr:hypothetical protein [bacterium]
MRKELEQIALIEAYLSNKLPQEEKQAFEYRMATSSELSDKVDFQRNMQRQLQREAMIAALATAHQNWQSQPWLIRWLRGRSFYFYLNTVLVVAVAAIALVYVWWNQNQEPTDKNAEYQVESTIQAIDNQEIVTISHTVEKLHFANDVEVKSAEATNEDPKTIVVSNYLANKMNVIEEEATFAKLMAISDSTSSETKYRKPVKYHYRISGAKGGLFKDPESGTTVKIPAEAFVDSTGNTVKDSVDILYREYRNLGDMVLSDIPMHWLKKGNNHYQFNSNGMFSITATADTNSLALAKSITINFKTNGQQDSSGFYYLSDTKSAWQLVKSLPALGYYVGKDRTPNLTGYSGEGSKRWSQPQRTGNGYYRYGFWGRLFEYIDQGTVYGNDSAAFKRIFSEKKLIRSTGYTDSTYVVPTKPSEMQKIGVDRLGYYNYDQLLHNPSAINPDVLSYFANGDSLVQDVYKYVAVEEGLNAAYHFYGSNVWLNSTKAYDIFVFTLSGKVYFADRRAFSQAKATQQTLSLTVWDVTEQLNCPDDVNELLNESAANYKKHKVENKLHSAGR